MKILIIGSSGFIGSHCFSQFKETHEVWGCDILPNNDSNYFQVERANSNFSSIFQLQKFDLCINCSGSADVPFSINNPSIDLQLNTFNVINILEAIRIFNPQCRFLTMSSAAVYGNPPSLPIVESCPINPVSPYGFHKMFAEKICEEYTKFWGIHTCCARIFSAYGPGLKKQIMWDMYNNFSTKHSIELWGTGNETRDFIFATDLTNALSLIIEHSDFNADVINVANGEQHSIAQIATLFAKEIGASTQTIKFSGAKRVGDPMCWEADISKLQKWGYLPQTSIEEGIKQYIQWAIKEGQ